MEKKLDKKYKKIPNNENTIEIDGKVVLSFDPRYKEYLKWRDENPDLEQQLIDDLEHEIENKRLYNNGAPHKTDNLYRWYRKNGILSLSCEMKNGEPEGLWIKYYENGHKMEEKTLKNGKEQGLFNQWYDNGQLVLSCEMKNGKRHGVEKGFYDTGEIRTVIHYKNGIRDGKLKSYHANFTEEKFRNNRIETWKNGKLHGEYIDYHLNNKERAKGDMLYGMMNGKWTFWYHNGKKELECEFDFGNPVGSAKIYNDNGILKEDVSF